MKIYGSVNGNTKKLLKIYNANGHTADLIGRIYAPAQLPDAFVCTIRAGGKGNITSLNTTQFTAGFKAREATYYKNIVVGNIIPLYFEITRERQLFTQKVTFYLHYRYLADATSADRKYTMMSYSGSSSDSDMRTYLGNYYGITYIDSPANGTDYIDQTMTTALKTKLIYDRWYSPY